MFLRYFYFILLLTALTAFSEVTAIEAYEVQFEGNLSPEILKLLKSSSDLINLEKSPPATTAGLRQRAEADIENFIQVLHSQAYYNATVTLDYNFESCPIVVIVHIKPGQVYPLSGFKVIGSKSENCESFSFESITPADIGIKLQEPALPKTILHAEETLLCLLAKKGYPLAVIAEREILADQKCQSISVVLHVDVGSIAYFGQTSIWGLERVKEQFLRKKINWKEGSIFNPSKIERTQNAIESTGLFSSVNITHDKTTTSCQQLPMRIEVIESKHRSIGWGLTYATQRGPGAGFEWENRNLFGSGEKLSFDTMLWKDLQDISLMYVKPDFHCRSQDLLWIAEALHDRTKGFTETFFSLSGLIEKHLNKYSRLSYGLTYKYLKDSRSEPIGEYNLIKIPFYFRMSNVKNVLDPFQGGTLNFRITPTIKIFNPAFGYCINTLTNTYYHSLTADNSFIFAFKATLGTIFGSNRKTIPASEKFYAGSDNLLRGYRFETVSPLNKANKPIGGRSMMIYAFELRVRATKSLGWVAFYDIGNVYANPAPDLNRKILQAVGFGLRYHTPVGPLRLDFAVPLNRRTDLDSRFQVYVSIGQAF